MTRHLTRVAAVLVLFSWSPAGQAPAPRAQYYNPRFSIDGTRVIFESTRDGKFTVYSINIDGTGLRRITDSRQNDAQPQWSPDGTLITFTAETGRVNKVTVMAANGRDRRQLSPGSKNDAAPSFSTDGKYVAWAATTELPENWRDISVAATSGTDGHRFITSGPGNDQSPVWISSTRVVFVREFLPKTDWMAMTPEEHAKRRASSEVMAVNADGSGLENLTRNAVFDWGPSWADSVQRIFFSSDRSGAAAFYSMNADGNDVRRIGDMSGSVSSDGRQITYSRVVGDRSGIFVRDLASLVERELVGGDKPRDVNQYGIKWSADGRYLTFESNMDMQGPGYAVYVVGADGTGLRNLTPGATEDVQPNWSPDGKEIAFSSTRDGHLDIYLMSADGSNPRRLTTTPGGGHYGSVFSPDGQWIAFQGRPDNALFADRIYVVKRDGTGFRELSLPTMNTMSPKWSPDSEWIAAPQQLGVKRTWDEMTPPDMQRANASEKAALFRRDGSETRVLGPGAMPDWAVRPASPEGVRSPDGTLLAYAKKSGTASGVYIRDVATGRERLVAGGG